MDFNIVENIAAFLVERTASCYGVWVGRMPKAEQIKHLGQYFGKGVIVVDGEREVIEHHIKVCFGTDSDINKRAKFGRLLKQQ